MGSVPGPPCFFVLLYAYLRRRAPVWFRYSLYRYLVYLMYLGTSYLVLRYTHITSIAIVYSRRTSIAIHELPKETSHVQL